MVRGVVAVGGVMALAGTLAAVGGGASTVGAETFFAVRARASVTSGGIEGDDLSTAPFVSADGDSVVFVSDATNLVPSDANAKRDAFLHRRSTGATSRVSVGDDEQEGNGEVESAAVSADGRYVAFASHASNLVVDDTNHAVDVFVRDTQLDTTRRVSLTDGGAQAGAYSGGPSISADGRYVAFTTDASLVPGDTNARTDVYVRDTVAPSTTLASVSSGGTLGDGSSAWAAISADGERVAFMSDATTLVEDDTNHQADVFVRDLSEGSTSLVSVADTGAQGDLRSEQPAISADGIVVAFRSASTTLVPGDTNRVPSGGSESGMDVFVHDLAAGHTERVSVSSSGGEAHGLSAGPSVSSDGRYVAFDSSAADLVADDTNGAVQDVFRHDRQTGDTVLVTRTSDGAQGAYSSTEGALSADGATAAFFSFATNLVPGDSNEKGDVFVARATTASLTLTKTADESAVVVGDDIHYRLTVENTGDVELTGVTVTDPAAPGCDAAVGTLAVAEEQTVDCVHTAVEADAGTFSNTAIADADQTAAVASNQVDVVVTTPPRPDLVVRRKGGPRVGAGIVDADAAGQTVTVGRARGGRGIFYVQVVNAGLEPGTFRVVRVGAADPHVSMRVFQGRSSVEVSDQILRHAYRTRSLAPGEAMTLRIELSVGAGAPHGATVVTLLRARSDGPTVHSDTVGAAVHVR